MVLCSICHLEIINFSFYLQNITSGFDKEGEKYTGNLHCKFVACHLSMLFKDLT